MPAELSREAFLKWSRVDDTRDDAVLNLWNLRSVGERMLFRLKAVSYLKWYKKGDNLWLWNRNGSVGVCTEDHSQGVWMRLTNAKIYVNWKSTLKSAEVLKEHGAEKQSLSSLEHRATKKKSFKVSHCLPQLETFCILKCIVAGTTVGQAAPLYRHIRGLRPNLYNNIH